MTRRLEFLLAFITLLAVFLIIATIFSTSEQSASISTTTNNIPVIVIDPGHGGFDSGAISFDDTYEKDINLAIGLRLYEILTLLGFEVVMTREVDEDVAYPVGTKKEDIISRYNLTEDIDNAVFISLHQNMYGIAKYSGPQVFYGDKHPDSQLFAQTIQDTLNTYLAPDNIREIKSNERSLYLLHNLTCPSILIECGFMSNPEELEKLKSDEYQNAISFNIAIGVMKYLGGENGS